MGQVFEDVFDAIADTREEAMNLKIRSSLMSQLIDAIKAKGWTQSEAADHLGVTQPRISDLFQGKLSKFSLDALVNLLAAMGKNVELRVA